MLIRACMYCFSRMFSEKSLGGNVRFIELKASFVMSDIGFDIIGGRGWGVFVSRINCEEHEKAGLKIGDKILEVLTKNRTSENLF